MPTQVARDAFVIRPPANLRQTHPELKPLASDLALSYVHRELVDDERLRRIGESLWRAAGDPDALDRSLNDALHAAGLAVLPIVIETADPLRGAVGRRWRRTSDRHGTGPGHRPPHGRRARPATPAVGLPHPGPDRGHRQARA